MRTTIRLDDDLLAKAKRHASDNGTTLTAVIEQSLRATLAHRHSTAPRKVIRLKTAGVGGTLAGVDLDDGASLLDRMDS
jgi:Arc/MetJ family transcription regulator